MDQKDTHRLGHYTGILAIDVRRFSSHNDVKQRKIVDLLPTVLSESSERAGIAGLMRDNVFRAFRGDGYLIGFNPDLMVAVVDKFFDSLQAELRRRSAELRSAAIELRIRASLHLGPVQSFNILVSDSPSGTVMVETGRMVDAEPVRALLDNSDPKVTLVAAVLSEEVMKQVVESGRTARQPSEFVPAPLRVEAKDYAGKGYLRVPVPSGDLLTSGLLHGQPEPSIEAADQSVASSGPASNSFTGYADKVIQARDVGGGIHDHSAYADGGIAVHGNGNVTAGGDIDKSDNKQEFSGQFNTQGDSNFGPSSGRRIRSNHDQAEL
ncbi:hypothetical protein OOZ19_04470 [Saccharopolyspora sp. NFXS83]|uniref:hypothetical protein n=1 Tax=Saccharopolyspora sp. NFXS83 TaxID=2993560 RepID=UPI00224B62A1|nr:hypothetical protein [Saccharopolyspora sp. NFXS83]MCX2729482.1 hypothetical protein [Saccharopolyspora sp. NFXS83]